jgi:hypothetical protein
MLLLPDFLSFDSILKIQSAQSRYCNALVRETPVKQPGSPLKWLSCPLFEYGVARQELYMLLAQLVCCCAEFERLRYFQGLAADMLHTVVSNV